MRTDKRPQARKNQREREGEREGERKKEREREREMYEGQKAVEGQRNTERRRCTHTHLILLLQCSGLLVHVITAASWLG